MAEVQQHQHSSMIDTLRGQNSYMHSITALHTYKAN
jgi:hypothetical protein